MADQCFAMVDISIIIPAYNSRRQISHCLEALSRQTVPRDNYEIIVVDDGSLDGTQAAAREFGVQVVRQTHAGPAAARNHGVNCSNGTILLFTDADCVPQHDWIEKMASSFRDPQVAGAKGVYRTNQRGLVARFVQAEFEEKYDRMGKAAYIDFVDTYSAGYRRSVFLENGGFDPTFPGTSAEDIEFSFRLSQRGYKMVFVPQAIVYHSHPASLWGYLYRKFRFSLWRTKVYARFPGKLGKDSYMPRAVPFQILSSALLAASLVVALFQPLALGATLVAAVAFISSIGPLWARTFARDKSVALVAPLLLFLRCLVQFLGLLIGGISSLGRREARRRVLGRLLGRETDVVS